MFVSYEGCKDRVLLIEVIQSVVKLNFFLFPQRIAQGA